MTRRYARCQDIFPGVALLSEDFRYEGANRTPDRVRPGLRLIALSYWFTFPWRPVHRGGKL